jgi:hypothetical protein
LKHMLPVNIQTALETCVDVKLMRIFSRKG